MLPVGLTAKAIQLCAAGFGAAVAPAPAPYNVIDRGGDVGTDHVAPAEQDMRPATNNDAKDISERLGTYTFRAKSRSFGMWGRGGGSVSESDQRRPLLLPQELMQLPEKDMIVLRLGIPPVYGKKIRYYQEKAMVALTKIPAPQMPNIRPDPAVTSNSLRVIAAAEADDENQAPYSSPDAPAPSVPPHPSRGVAGSAHHRLNQAAIDAAMAAPAGERTAKLFQHIVMVEEGAAA